MLPGENEPEGEASGSSTSPEAPPAPDESGKSEKSDDSAVTVSGVPAAEAIPARTCIESNRDRFECMLKV